MKFRKILLFLMIVFLLIWPFWDPIVSIAESINFHWNPMVKAEYRRMAQEHLDSEHPDLDVRIESVQAYNKPAHYSIKVVSDHSKDTYFYLRYYVDDRPVECNYNKVISRMTTLTRLSQKYDTLVNEALQTFLPKEISVCSSWLAMEDSSVLALDMELTTDLCAEYGSIDFKLYSEDFSADYAAELLLELKARLDQANLPFSTITLRLLHSDNGKPELKGLWLWNFPSAEIAEENLSERINQWISSH